MTNANHVVVAVFENRKQAQQALQDLRSADFAENCLGLITRSVSRDELETSETSAEADWEDGSAVGVASGAALGSVWGIGMAVGAVPVVGPILAGGALLGILASAAGTATVGGILGGLIGLGLHETEAEAYEEDLKAGRTLLTVHTDGRSEQASGILSRNGGTIRVGPKPAAYATSFSG